MSGPSAQKSMQEKIIVAALPYALEFCLQVIGKMMENGKVMLGWRAFSC